MKTVLLMVLLVVSCVGQENRVDPAKSKSESAGDGISRDQANAILQELKAIHQLLDRQVALATGSAQPQPQAPQNVSMKVESGWAVLGRDDAPVTVVEFADYQCPFCRRYHASVYAELKKNYIDTGKVRYMARDFPLDFHSNAMSAALAARCAGEQKQFWEMRDLLLGGSGDLSSESITKYGNQIRLDMDRFRTCMDSKKYSADVKKDIAAAGTLGVNATPSFVIGSTAKDQINGVRIMGALPYSKFEELIQRQSTHAP